MNNIIAKNLLLGKSCFNCKNASSLASRESFNLEIFEAMTGIKRESIHEGCFINNKLYICYHWFKALPIELTCTDWKDKSEI